MKSFFFVFTLFIGLNSFAKEFKLFKINNEMDSEYSVLSVETNDTTGDFVKLKKEVFSANKISLSKVVWSAKNLASGVVAYNVSGRDIVKLQSSNLNLASGGTIELNYLVNAITGDWENLDLELLKTAHNQWATQCHGKKVGTLHFVSNKFLGKVVGVESIDILPSF